MGVRPDTATLGSLALLFWLVGGLSHSEEAFAEPVVQLAWHTCGSSGATDLVTESKGSDVFLVAWVEGQEAGHQGYSVTIEWKAAAGGSLPDAWRFDSEGCQPESLIRVDHLNPIPHTASCWTGLCGTSSFSRQSSMIYEPSTGTARLSLEVLYPQGIPAGNPSLRYLLTRTTFFLSTFGREGESEIGTCGGLEQPVCFRLVDARYQNLAGTWVPWTIGNSIVSVHGESVPAPDCLAVPARPSTWGRIKTQYHSSRI